MRPIRTIAPLALGLAALAVAGCQGRSHAPAAATQVERAATAPARQATPPSRPAQAPVTRTAAEPAPAPETVVGLWPARTLQQAKDLQGGADAGHQPWVLSPELVSTSYAAAKLGLFHPVARQVGPAAWQVRADHGEWAATLRLAQPVRHGAGGVWVVTQVER
jgi:hypothetical protein